MTKRIRKAVFPVSKALAVMRNSCSEVEAFEVWWRAAGRAAFSARMPTACALFEVQGKNHTPDTKSRRLYALRKGPPPARSAFPDAARDEDPRCAGSAA